MQRLTGGYHCTLSGDHDATIHTGLTHSNMRSVSVSHVCVRVSTSLCTETFKSQMSHPFFSLCFSLLVCTGAVPDT